MLDTKSKHRAPLTHPASVLTFFKCQARLTRHTSLSGCLRVTGPLTSGTLLLSWVHVCAVWMRRSLFSCNIFLWTMTQRYGVIPKICISFSGKAPRGWRFCLGTSPCLGSDAFRELDLKETCEISVTLIAHIQILVLLRHPILWMLWNICLLLFSFPACTAFGGQRI